MRTRADYVGGMVPLLIFAMAPWWMPSDPETDQLMSQLSADLQIISVTHADTVANDLAKCAIVKIRSYSPNQDEVGQSIRGSDFLDQSLNNCGIEQARNRVRETLRVALPKATKGDLDRLEAAAFVFPMLVLTMAINRVFELPSQSRTPDIPVEIPPPYAEPVEPPGN